MEKIDYVNIRACFGDIADWQTTPLGLCYLRAQCPLIEFAICHLGYAF